MSDPLPPFETPRPFADRPRQPAGGDWVKPLAVGCGLFLLLLVIGLSLLVVNADSLFRWGLEALHQQIVSSLPPEFPAPERERLDAAFEAAAEAVRAGEVDPGDLQRLQAEVFRLSRRPPGPLTAPELEGLFEALERVGGVQGAPEGGEEDDEDVEPRAGIAAAALLAPPPAPARAAGSPGLQWRDGRFPHRLSLRPPG